MSTTTKIPEHFSKEDSVIIDKCTPAKRELLIFIKTTELGETYTFDFLGNPAQANRFVAHMRTQMSKLRGTIRLANKTPRQFKILTESMTIGKHIDDLTKHEVVKTTVVLKKAETTGTNMKEAIGALSDQLIV